MSSSRRIYVSAVHEEFPEALESLRLALEELGCEMVVLDTCPPYWRTLDKRLRDRIPTCEAVLHIAGQRCGRCPDIPTVPKGQTRRGIAQMELDISTEIAATASKLPLGVHSFISGEDHSAPEWLKAEDEAQKQLQAEHRETLQASGKAHAMPHNGEAWKESLSKLLGISVSRADAYQPPPPNITIRPAKQEQTKEGGGMSPLAIGVIVVGALVVGLGLLDMMKSKKPAEAAAAAEVIAPYDAAQAHQVLENYATIYRDWMRDTVDMPVMYLDHWTRLTLPQRVKLSDAQVKSLLEQSVTQDIGPGFTVEDRLAALLAAGKYQGAIDFALLHQATLSAEGLETAAIAAASRFDQTVSTSHEDRAIRFCRSAVEKTDAQKDPAGLSRRQAALATLLDTQGLKAEAQPLAEACVAALEKDPALAPLELAYARLLAAQNQRGEKALELGRKAVTLFDQDAYKEAPLKLTAWSMLATVLLNQTTDAGDRTQEAVELLRKAVSESEQKFGPSHPLTGYHLYRLGSTMATQAGSSPASADQAQLKSQLAEAETYLQRALAIHEAGYGTKHLNVAYALTAFGQLFETQGRFAEAEPMYQRALTAAVDHLGHRHPKLAPFKINLAVCLQKNAKDEESGKLLREAVQEMESFGVASKQEMCEVYQKAAGVLQRLRKHADSARYLEKALNHAPEENVTLRATISFNLYNAHILDQRLGEARLAAEKGIPIVLRSKLYTDDPTKALIPMLRTHAVWKTQLGETSAALKQRYQSLFRDAGLDNDFFETIWDKISR